MEIERIYYRLWEKPILRIRMDKAEFSINAGIPLTFDNLCAINIESNNSLFIEELETIIPKGFGYCNNWLRGLIADYVKRCSRDNGDTPYLLEYYIDWLNNTMLILNGKYPFIDEWCKEYREWIIDYFQKESTPISCQPEQEAVNDGGKQIEKIINEEALKKYFTATFKGAGNNGFNYFDYLIEDIKKVRNPKEAARMALIIYESDKMIKTQKPNTFKEWYRSFCEMAGCPYNPDYKPSNLDTNKMKIKLSYL